MAGFDIEEVRQAEREASGGAGDLEVATETGADHRVTRGRGLIRREAVLRQVIRGVYCNTFAKRNRKGKSSDCSPGIIARTTALPP